MAASPSRAGVVTDDALGSGGGIHDDYLLEHGLPNIVEHLSLALLRDKPEDHVAFTRRWLANLRENMIACGQDTCRGINLFAIDGNRIQRFASTLERTMPLVESEVPPALAGFQHGGGGAFLVAADGPEAGSGQDMGSTTTLGGVTPSLISPCAHVALAETLAAASNHPQGERCDVRPHASGNTLPPVPKKVVKKANSRRGAIGKPALEQIGELAEKLHRDDASAAVAYLQTLLTRRAEKQQREAEESRMLKKFHTQHAQASAHNNKPLIGNDRFASGGAAAAAAAVDGEHGQQTAASLADGSLNEPTRRRIAISATPFNVEEASDFQIKEIDKTPTERTELLQCVEQCSLFTAFDDAQKELVVRAMVKVEFPAGCDILTQGQPGKETFFLVLVGMAEVIKDRRVVAPINPGMYFGELELMYNEPSCAATVKTITPVTAYGLGKETYQHIVLNAALQRRALFLKQIEAVGIFEPLTGYDKMRVAEALTIQQCTKGDVLIRCGEPVHWMYVVMEGVTRVVGRDPTGAPIDVIDLGVGQVVGELEFVFHHSAVADVVVLSARCRVAKLNRKHFEAIVGADVTDAMKQYIATKDMYSHYMAHAEDSVKRDIEGAQKRAARREKARPGLGANPLGGGSFKAGYVSNLHPEGEIIIDYSATMWRFPLQGLTTGSKVVAIAILEDGTVLKWNDVVARATQYKSDQAVGQSIFSFLTSQEEQSSFHSMLRVAREWMSNWDGFAEAGLHKPRLFGFTQSEGLTKVQLSLSVVPAVGANETSAAVFLAVGTEVKVRPPSTAIDLGNWLSEKLKPRLTHIARVLSEPELSAALIRKAKAGVVVCERTLDQFVRIAQSNVEELQEGWRPVSLHVYFQRVLSLVSAAVRDHGNRIVVEIDEEFPSQDVFLDTDNLIQALALLIEDANTSLRGVDIYVRADAVSHDAASAQDAATLNSSTSMSHSHFALARSMNSNDDGSPLSPRSGHDTPEATAGFQQRRVTGGGPKLLRIIVEDSAVGAAHHPDAPLRSPAHCGTIPAGEDEAGSDGAEDIGSGIACRGSHLSDVRHYLTSMNGVLSYFAPTEQCGTRYRIELPLVLSADGGGGADAKTPGGTTDAAGQQHTFTTVLVERSPVQRSNICQVLWSRRHAVLPVGTWIEVSKLVASSTCDILVVDPECLRDDPSFAAEQENGKDPFATLRSLGGAKIAIIVTSDTAYAPPPPPRPAEKRGEDAVVGTPEYSRKESLSANAAMMMATSPAAASSAVLQLPKPWHMTTLVDTFSAAEALVVHYREEEARIAAMRSTFSETKRGKHTMVRLLGRGAFGEVHEVLDELTGGRMAMKTMRLKKEADVDTLVEEIRTMTNLQHENIIHYFYCEKSSNSELKIFMELAVGGTLQDKIKRTPGGCGLSHVEIVRHLKDLISGLVYIHSHGYVHCDIKTANALLDAKERTKLGDFGCAKKLKVGEYIHVMSGTPSYMAPEVMAADATEHLGYDFKADIWSLGCVAMEMATGQPPFSHVENTQGMGIFRYISELTEAPDLSPLFRCSPLLFSFVRACLEPKPSKRPSAEELLKFALMTQDSGDSTLQADKLVKRAQLLHDLSKFVAFHEEGTTVSYGANSADDRYSYGSGDGENGSFADSHLDKLAKDGGFFSDDDDDDDEEEDGNAHLEIESNA